MASHFITIITILMVETNETNKQVDPQLLLARQNFTDHFGKEVPSNKINDIDWINAAIAKDVEKQEKAKAKEDAANAKKADEARLAAEKEQAEKDKENEDKRNADNEPAELKYYKVLRGTVKRVNYKSKVPYVQLTADEAKALGKKYVEQKGTKEVPEIKDED